MKNIVVLFLFCSFNASGQVMQKQGDSVIITETPEPKVTIYTRQQIEQKISEWSKSKEQAADELNYWISLKAKLEE